ncbi:hypothetical protein HYS00_05025, partial [Candidatus Microgenomates bacterium]|nr:hypothetical protein [Candidatus Microgenomates bacterium]
KWFLPSMFYSVAHEPNRSAEYKVAHDKQRKRNQYIGIGLVVSAITAGFAILERLQSKKK